MRAICNGVLYYHSHSLFVQAETILVAAARSKLTTSTHLGSASFPAEPKGKIYFSLGPVDIAYRAIDSPWLGRWLCRKQKVATLLEDMNVMNGRMAIGDVHMPTAFQRSEHHE